MNRRTLSRLAVVLLVIAFLLPASATLAANGGPVSPDMQSGATPAAAMSGAASESSLATADIFVDRNYTSATPGWNVTAFDTIQGGVNAAAEGKTVLVYPGSYAENVTVGKGLTLKSFAGNGNFSTAVNLGPAAPGVWYTDRYAPAVFEATTFNGQSVLKHGVPPRQTSSRTGSSIPRAVSWIRI